MTMIRAHLGERSYDIALVSGDLAGVGPFARARCRGALAFVVGDTNVTGHATAVGEALTTAGFTVRSAVLPPGEGQKCLASASRLYDELADARADRQTLVVVVGGGVVGDLAGFVAATWN